MLREAAVLVRDDDRGVLLHDGLDAEVDERREQLVELLAGLVAHPQGDVALVVVGAADLELAQLVVAAVVEDHVEHAGELPGVDDVAGHLQGLGHVHVHSRVACHRRSPHASDSQSAHLRCTAPTPRGLAYPRDRRDSLGAASCRA